MSLCVNPLSKMNKPSKLPVLVAATALDDPCTVDFKVKNLAACYSKQSWEMVAPSPANLPIPSQYK